LAGGRAVMETQDGLNKCLAKAAELSTNVSLWYVDEKQFLNLFKDGQIAGGQCYNDVAQVLVDDGYPIRSTFPKEGDVMDFGSLAIL
tara:strand:+ start:577 stop:837 length:261 start_codon:yes stop_codon:yes gene_type:complete